MAKKPEGKRKLPVRISLLSEADREALTTEARASIAAEMEQDARTAYFQSELDRLRRAELPAEQYVHVTIDAAPYVPFIMIDNVQFFHGYTYEVEVRQARVLYEQMQRSWMHQDEIDGRGKTEAYRRPRNVALGPQHAGTVTRGVNGPVVLEGL